MNTQIPPQPAPDIDSAGFWRATSEGRLALQCCEACGQYQFPPLEACRHCAGKLVWKDLSGRGVIHTFIIEHQPVAPGFDDKRPYPIALVCPEEAPHVRLPSQIETDSLDKVKVGAKVTARIVPLTGGDVKIPVFALDA